MRPLPVLFLVAAWLSPGHASESLQQDDLSRLATLAMQERLPILLIVSQHDCPFCVRLREEILHPMQRSGDLEGRARVAEIFIDSPEPILDLRGHRVTPDEIAGHYRVWVTPTLLFLDARGREVHRRMLGVNTIELYGYYLEESLAAAFKAVRDGDRSYAPSQEDILGDAPGFDQVN